MLKKSEIVQQSEAALNQWRDQWVAHAQEHKAKYPMESILPFENIGVGKTLLLVANGYSLEENIETIKAHQGQVDIMACDKTLKNLLEHGIVPTYCMVCDANVSFEKYLEPVKDQLKDTILFMNVCGNPKWTKEEWKARYFFVNKDAIKSEELFSKESGCSNFIAAGTNVSGAMVVLTTQCDQNGRNNFMGYDKILCIGFDHSWRPDGKYYAFDDTASGKVNYMRHSYVYDRAGRLCFTSGNLSFSARWLADYVTNFKLPVLLGSDHTIVQGIPTVKLEDHIGYKYRAEDGPEVRAMVEDLKAARLKVQNLKSTLGKISQEHWQHYRESL